MLRARQPWRLLDAPTLWRYRELLWFLALRDVQVRYKETLLGAAWAIVQPVAMMLVFTVLIGRCLGVDQKTDVPYPIFVFAGVVPWTFFAAAVMAATNSLVANAQMIRKIYFPRLIVPLAAVGAPLVDYAMSLLVLAGLMIWYAVTPTWQILLVPVLVGATVLAAVAVGVSLAALTVSYRDFRYVASFLLQVWFYLTPVVYPVTVVPTRWRWLLALNPMSGTIEAFRAAVLGTAIDWAALTLSVAVSGVCLTAGLALFAKAERRVADVV